MLRVKNTFKRPKWLPNVGCDILRFDVHSLPPPLNKLNNFFLIKLKLVCYHDEPDIRLHAQRTY